MFSRSSGDPTWFDSSDIWIQHEEVVKHKVVGMSSDWIEPNWHNRAASSQRCISTVPGLRQRTGMYDTVGWHPEPVCVTTLSEMCCGCRGTHDDLVRFCITQHSRMIMCWSTKWLRVKTSACFIVLNCLCFLPVETFSLAYLMCFFAYWSLYVNVFTRVCFVSQGMCEEGPGGMPELMVVPPPPPRRTLPDPQALGPPPLKPCRPPSVNLTPYLPPPLEGKYVKLCLICWADILELSYG